MTLDNACYLMKYYLLPLCQFCVYIAKKNHLKTVMSEHNAGKGE